MVSMSVSFVVPRMTHGFVLYPVELKQVRLWQGYETQTIVNDAEYHTSIQQEQMTLFDAFWSHGF